MQHPSPSLSLADPYVLRIIGPSGVGKTTLLEAILRELTRRGRRVAAVKHTSHAHPVDSDGTDSDRLRLAAGGAAAFVTPDGLVLHRSSIALLDLVRFAFGDCEIVLVEGWRSADTPALRLLHHGADPDQHRPMAGAVVGWVVRDGSAAPGAPALPWDPAALAAAITRLAALPGPPAPAPAPAPRG